MTEVAVLEFLKAMRDQQNEKLDSIRNEALTVRNELRQDIKLLHERMSVFEKHMSALVSASTYHEERYATLEKRLDRLEARLEIANG